MTSTELIHDYCPRIRADLDVAAWRFNYRAISAAVAPATVVPVIKANAYGLGAAAAAEAFCAAGAGILAVACLEEGLNLRHLPCQILLLGSFLPEELPLIIEAGLVPSVVDLSSAEQISKLAQRLNRQVAVHIKIDTGMGRLGLFCHNALAQVLQITQMPGIYAEGIYSHLAAAAYYDTETMRQIRIFQELIRELDVHGRQFRWRHIASSTAAAGIAETIAPPFNMVRSGIDLHGGHLASIMPRPYKTLPVLRLASRLVNIRTVPAGHTISYGRTYTVAHAEGERIGVVPFGYADGFPRCLSNRGQMLVGGKRCPVVGIVCMDYTMLNIGAVTDAEVGDEVVLIGRQGDSEITIGEVARAAETIPYELMSKLGPRVRRCYYDSDAL